MFGFVTGSRGRPRSHPPGCVRQPSAAVDGGEQQAAGETWQVSGCPRPSTPVPRWSKAAGGCRTPQGSRPTNRLGCKSLTWHCQEVHGPSMPGAAAAGNSVLGADERLRTCSRAMKPSEFRVYAVGGNHTTPRPPEGGTLAPRFMGSLHDSRIAQRDLEPPRTSPHPALSPLGAAGRGWRVAPGEGKLMEWASLSGKQPSAIPVASLHRED
jgi:hypothetical protein